MMAFSSDISEEMLRQIEDEYEAQKSKLEVARTVMKHQKSTAIRKKVEMLQSNVEELNKKVDDTQAERKSLRQLLVDKKNMAKKSLVAQQEAKRNAWCIERDHQLEDVAQRRIDLDAIQNERQRIESLLDSTSIQLDAIEVERKRRTETKEQQLSRLLERGEVLRHELENGHLVVPDVLKQIEEIGHQHFVEECHGERLRRQNQEQIKLHRHLQELNEARERLHSSEIQLRETEAAYAAIVAQGIDHLVDVKLGTAIEQQACPVISHEPPATPNPRDNIDDILAEAAQLLSQGGNVLTKLELDISLRQSEVQPPNNYCYNGEYGADTFLPWQLPIRAFVVHIVEELIDELPLVPRRKKILKSHQRDWRATQRSILRTRRREIKIKAIVELRNDLLDQVIYEMIIHLYSELSDIHNRIRKLVGSTLLQKVISNDEHPLLPQLSLSYSELRRRQNRDDTKVALSNHLFPMHKLSQTVVHNEKLVETPPTKKKWFATHEKELMPVETKSVPKKQNTPPKQLSARTQPPSIMAKESNYWKQVQIFPVEIKLPCDVNCVQVYRMQHKSFLIAGGSKGEVIVFDLSSMTPILQRLDPPAAYLSIAIQCMAFHLLVTASDQVNLWTTKPTTDAQISLVFKLSHHDLSLPNPSEITTGTLPPSLSLVGTPTAVLVGLKDGDIVRLNRSFEECLPVFGKSKATRDTDGLDTKREIFHHHQAAIVNILCPSQNKIVSVDVSGLVCLWEYSELSLTGFGWFEPREWIQIDCKGRVQSAKLTHELDTLVVYFYDVDHREGRFIKLSIYPKLEVRSIQIRFGCGSPPPPFAILPPLEGIESEYIIVMATTLTIYSLITGQLLGPSPECKWTAVSLATDNSFIIGCGHGKLMSFVCEDHNIESNFPTISDTGIAMSRLETKARILSVTKFVEDMLCEVVKDLPINEKTV